MTSLEAVLLRGVEKIYPSKQALEKTLKSGRKLKIYYGIDPTSTNIHIGHGIPLRKLKQFQDLGHRIILLIGDFTAMIGDPSDRNSLRKPLTASKVKENVSSYKNQLSRILSFTKNPPEIIYNSKWWGVMQQSKFFELLSKFTVAHLLERDMFQNRIKKNKPIAVSEFLYPILQGYDSVAMDVDMEIGATDQTFNMLSGRQLLRQERGKEKFVLTTPLLAGTDGRKMGKTYGNTINITENANNMYGKIMSIHDGLIITYLTLATDFATEAIDEIDRKIKNGLMNPINAKKKLAFEVVKTYCGNSAANKAQKEFERVFQKGGTPKPKTIPWNLENEVDIVDLLVASGSVGSKSQGRRIVEQGGVEINNQKLTSPNKKFVIQEGSIVRVGKRKAIKVTSGGKK